MVCLVCCEGCDNIKFDVFGDFFYFNILVYIILMMFEEIKMVVDMVYVFGCRVNVYVCLIEGVKCCL